MKSTMIAVFGLMLAQVAAQFVAQTAHAESYNPLKYRKVNKERLKELVDFQEPLNVSEMADLEEALVGYDSDRMWTVHADLKTSDAAEDSKGLYTLKEQNFSKDRAGTLLDSIEVVRNATGGFYYRSMKHKNAFKYLTLSAIHKHVLRAQNVLSFKDISFQYTESVEGAIKGRVNVYRRYFF